MNLPVIYSINQIPEGLFVKGIPVGSPEHAEELFKRDGYTRGWVYRTHNKTWRLVVGLEEYNYILINSIETWREK